MVEQGKIRVGKIRYINGQQIIPTYEGYENIICMTKSSEYGAISPYCLKDDNGYIIENVYQFSKLYNRVADSQQKYSRYDSRIIWRWKSNIFIQNDKILPDYWLWRKKGMQSPDPIRYPVGFNGRSTCIGAIKTYDIYDEPKNLTDFEILDYIESRKQLYYPLYVNAVKKHRQYKVLQDKLNQGINLLICEIDCSYQDSLDYYKQTYKVNDNFIKDWTMEVNKENMEIVLNDTRHAFGHGYCLAMSLLDISID
jgi:hypothetical protein